MEILLLTGPEDRAKPSNTVSFTIKAQSLLRCKQIILLTKKRTLSKERGGVKQRIHRGNSEFGAHSGISRRPDTRFNAAYTTYLGFYFTEQYMMGLSCASLVEKKTRNMINCCAVE